MIDIGYMILAALAGQFLLFLFIRRRKSRFGRYYLIEGILVYLVLLLNIALELNAECCYDDLFPYTSFISYTAYAFAFYFLFRAVISGRANIKLSSAQLRLCELPIYAVAAVQLVALVDHLTSPTPMTWVQDLWHNRISLFIYFAYSAGCVCIVRLLQRRALLRRRRLSFDTAILSVVAAICAAGSIWLKDACLPSETILPITGMLLYTAYALVCYRFSFGDLYSYNSELINAIPGLGVICFDNDGKVIDLNDTSKKMLEPHVHPEREDYIPDVLNELQKALPESNRDVFSRLHAFIEGDTGGLCDMVFSFSNDRYVRITASRFYKGGNKLRGMSVAMLDVSQIVRLNKLVRAQNEQLTDANASLEAHIKLVESLVVERERNNLVQQFHDSLGYRLALLVGMARNMSAHSGDEDIGALASLADDCLEELRELVQDEYVRGGQTDCLRTRLERMIGNVLEHGFLKVDWSIDDMDGRAIGIDVENAVLSIVRESLTNTLRHSDAKSVKIAGAVENDVLRLRVEDDGAGAQEIVEGTGLKGMHTLIRDLGGSIEFSGGGELSGFVVEVTIPLNGEDKKRIRLLVADDHELMRSTIRGLLEDSKEIEIVGEAENGLEAFELCKKLLPDVVLMDIKMPRLDGIEATRLIRGEFPQISILGISTYTDDTLIHKMLEAGADGYMFKNMDTDALVNAIKSVWFGLFVTDKSFGTSVYAPKSEPEELRRLAIERYSLSEIEQSILGMVAHGLRNEEIAAKVFYTQGSLRNIFSGLYTRIGVSDKLNLALFAISNGFGDSNQD